MSITTRAERAVIVPSRLAPHWQRMLIGWAVLCVVLTQMHVWNIGNGAHIGGLIYGIVCGLIYGLPRYRYAFVGLAIVIPIVLTGALVLLLTSQG